MNAFRKPSVEVLDDRFLPSVTSLVGAITSPPIAAVGTIQTLLNGALATNPTLQNIVNETVNTALANSTVGNVVGTVFAIPPAVDTVNENGLGLGILGL